MRIPRAAGAAALLLVAGLASVPSPAQAVQAPARFSAVDLTTWQTNGVAWSVASSGGLVFVGGTFTSIRPAGSPEGQGELTRRNFAVFDAATGAPTSCAPAFTVGSGTATVRALDVSPDGATLYIGGYFSSAGSASRQHLAALTISSCTIDSGFRPAPSGTVRAVDSTSSTVYFGGALLNVGGTGRDYAAAVGAAGASNAGALLSFDPSLSAEVRAIAVSPDRSVVVIGGDFETANGAASRALVVVNATSGANVKAFGSFVPSRSVVKDIAVDASGFYTGNEGNGGGVFDGRIAVNWGSYAQRWRDTCLGATQAVLVHQAVLYSASHAHDCSSMGAYPDGARYHFLAQSVNDPTLLPWFPNTNEGLGEGIGPRDLTVATSGGADYLWAVGEFTRVNGKSQTGITRFGPTPDAAPSTPAFHVGSDRAGRVTVAWRQSLDLDNSDLTYRVYRDNGSTPVHTVSGTSWFWDRKQLSFTDQQPAGTSHSYRVAVTDGVSTVTTASRSVTVASTTSAYGARVASDGAQLHWRYDEPSNVLLSDSTTNNNNATLTGGATTYRVTPDALAGDPSTAMSFAGVNTTAYTERRFSPPTAYTLETWFRTSTNAGGKLLGLGNKQSFRSSNTDKNLYMTNSGRLAFGIRSGSSGRVVVQSGSSYNDGRWHHVAATQGSGGLALYVDGNRVASSSSNANYGLSGYWRLGGDSLSGWTSAPSSEFWSGTLDETAIYPSALSASTVAAHHDLGVDGPGGSDDTTPPSTPTGLTASASSLTVSLAWSASTDDVGVDHYDVYRSQTSGFNVGTSTFLRSTTSRSITDDVPSAGSWYYRVVAVDGSDNRSGASAQARADATAPPSGTTVTLTPTADTYANQGAPATNYGTTASLVSRGSIGAVSYLRFPLPTAPAGTSLVSASLRIRTTGDSFAGSAESHTITFADDTWTESALTWNNRPALIPGTLGTLPGGTQPSTAYSITLDESDLDGELGSQVTLAVSNAGTDNLWFSSSQAAASSRPQLVLTFD